MDGHVVFEGGRPMRLHRAPLSGGVICASVSTRYRLMRGTMHATESLVDIIVGARSVSYRVIGPMMTLEDPKSDRRL